MKKFRALAAAGICVLLLVNAICVFFVGRKPFKDLDASEIALATVWITPPNKAVEIEETEQLAEYLRNAVIYNRDNSHTRYGGQGVIFTLTMTDGTRTEISAGNPEFLIIDGVGYRTKYEPCQALDSFANGLLEVDALVALEEPPVLTIVSGQMAGGAILGTYSWQRKNYDGTITGIDVDSVHPLDCKDRLRQFRSPEATVMLRFDQEPDEILDICCWSDEHWSDLTADSEEVVWEGNEIVLKPGGYIYEVTARWNAESGYGGTASYSVYVYSTP